MPRHAEIGYAIALIISLLVETKNKVVSTPFSVQPLVGMGVCGISRQTVKFPSLDQAVAILSELHYTLDLTK